MATNLQFDVSALDKASATFVKMAAQVERLAAKLDKLDGKKVDVEADVDTKKAEATLGKFETDLRRKLAAATKALPEVNLDVDASQADQTLARIRQEMQSLTDKRLGVDIDSRDAIAQISRLKSELEAVGRESTNIQVKADTGAAVAELAAVEAAVAAIDGADATVDVEVDSAPVEAATSALGDMVGMAEAVAAAWPPVSAGILAIPGALALIAAPLATVAVGMDGIKAAANQLIPAFTQLQRAVGQAFLSGLQPAVADLAKTFPALQTGMTGTASALSQIATAVTGVVSSSSGLKSLTTIFDGVNRIVASLAPAIGTLTQNFLDLATAGLSGLSGLGPMLQQVGQAWSQVIAQMNQTGTVQAAVSGLVDVLGAVLNILPPLVQAGAQLMATLGPPLAAALNAVAGVVGFLAGPLGGVTTAVLALAAAWKVGAIAGAAFATLGTKIASGYAAMTGASAAAAAGARAVGTASAAAGAGTAVAASGASRVAAGFSKIGATLPVVGALLIGGSMLWQSYSDKAEDAASNILAGSQSIQSALQDEFQTLNKWSLAWSIGTGTQVSATEIQENYAEATRSVIGEMKQQASMLTGVEKAQANVKIAQTELAVAQQKGAAGAADAAAATLQLQQATIDLQLAQSKAALQASNLGLSYQTASQYFQSGAGSTDRAAASAKTLADAYTGLMDPLTSVADKASAFTAAFQQAVDPAVASAEATRALNDSMRQLDGALTPASAKLIQLNGTINTTTEAGSQLQQSVLQTAAAIQNDYGTSVAAATANGVELTKASGDAAAAFEKQKSSLVQLLVQQGVAQPAAQALADTYLKFPTSISTTFSQPGMVKAIADSFGLSGAIIGIPDNKTVIVNSLTQTAQQQLEDLGLTVTRLPNGQIVITARDETSPTVAAAVTFANGQKGTILLDGNATEVNGKIQQSVTLADGSKGTMTIDGDPDPATGQITAVVDLGNGKHTVIKIDPKDNATPVIQSIQGKTVYINVVTTGVAAAQSAVASAAAAAAAAARRVGGSGGAVAGFAGGGIRGVGRAARGAIIPGYAPGVDDQPFLLSRGEAVLVPELVRALGASRILAANHAASGGRPASVVGDVAGLMDGIIPTQRATTGANLNGRPTIPARPAWPAPRPTGGGVDLGPLRAEVAGLRADLNGRIEDLRADLAGSAAADRTTARNTGALVAEARRSRPGAAAVASGARTQAALGMFG